MNTDVADAFDAGQWSFTPAVVAQFDDHVRASVPFYDAIQAAVVDVSDWLAPAGSIVADLGASTGTTARAIHDRQPSRERVFHLYDESAEMVAAARVRLAELPHVEYHERTLQAGLEHVDASLTLALFTLQFLSPGDRAAVLADAYARSSSDGAILVAEKVRPEHGRWAEVGVELSWDYKESRGISADSVRAKARALRGVLRPQTDAQNFAELHDAGWTDATVLFRWHQWSLYGAFSS